MMLEVWFVLFVVSIGPILAYWFGYHRGWLDGRDHGHVTGREQALNESYCTTYTGDRESKEYKEELERRFGVASACARTLPR